MAFSDCAGGIYLRIPLPYAESLRQNLFFLRSGLSWTATDASPEAVDKLNDGMIRALEEATASGGRKIDVIE